MLVSVEPSQVQYVRIPASIERSTTYVGPSIFSSTSRSPSILKASADCMDGWASAFTWD